MTDTNNVQEQYQAPVRNPDLDTLNLLVGTWKVSGGVEGQITYEWMEGKFFLLQHIDFGSIKGIEVIGHEQPFGREPSADIKSRYYGSQGETFDYVYEVEGDTLTIWGGMKGSPAYYKGNFSADGNTLSGAWVYPDGGGYESTSVRVK